MHPICKVLVSKCFLISFIQFQANGQHSQITHDQVPGYEVRHYTDENGLPQNSVKSIVKDERGYIWMTTERGLIRYDGYRLVKFDQFGDSYASRNMYGFQLHPSNPTSELLAMTHEGKWIRISNGEARIDPKYKGYPAYEPSKDPAAREDPVIQSLPFVFENQYRNILSRFISIYPFPASAHFTYHDNLVSYYHKNKLVKRFSFPNASSFNFFRLGSDLYFLDKGLNLFQFTSAGSDSSVRKIAIGGEIAQHKTLARHNEFLPFWNNVSEQVFVLLNKSLYLLTRNKSGIISSKLILKGFDLRKHSIKAVYYDHLRQRVYLGSPIEGLYIADRQPFHPVSDPESKGSGLYGQTLLGDNQILTPDGNIFKKEPVSGAVTMRRMQLLSKLVNWDPISVLKSRSGDIWAKQGEEIFQFDSTGSTLLSKWLIKGGVTNLYEGNNGRIWIGTTTKGLYYLDPFQPKAQPSPFPCKILPRISWIEHQTADSLWIGTGKGLYCLHLPTGKLSAVAGLENIYIRSLHIPKGLDEVWITTYTSGFFLLKGNKLTRFPLDRQQHLASAHCIFQDKKGFFWVPTNRGLFQIKKSDLLTYVEKPFTPYYHYYAKNAGFNTNEFNGGCQPCAVRMADGTASFPSMNGLVWFVPEKIKPELPDGRIFVDSSEQDDSTFTIEQNKLHVKAGTPQIILKISTPHFGEAYNLRMFYRIFKGDEVIADWKEIEDSRSIAVPFHGGGQYKLLVRKLGGFGMGNLIATQMDIEVEKRWYETWWLRGFVMLTGLVLLYFIFTQRVKAIKRRNLVLEGKIRERTQELEKTLSVLSGSERQLEQQVKLQIHMIASISHDIRTPVKHMSYALGYSQGLIEENQPEKAVLFLQQMKQAVDNMYYMVDNLVNYIKPEMRGVGNAISQVRLSALIEDRILLFDQIAKANNAKIQTNIRPDHIVASDAKLLGIIVHNLIDNAIKVRSGNTLRIYAHQVDDAFRLAFEDDGPGLPSELVDWLNRADSAEDASLPTGYEGLGLLLLKQISKILRVKLFVSNVPGARIELIFLDVNIR